MNTVVKKMVAFCLVLMLGAGLAGCAEEARIGEFMGEADSDALWGEPALSPGTSFEPSATVSANASSENWTISIYMNGSDL
ncbi:MAG: hypothetical protein AAGU32_15065, partial [Bacillota bacterium]